MPRLLHVSDTHLGFQAYTRLTPDGLNQREVDAQDALRRVVDAALADPPDLFLHTGDLFDHPRPSNRAIAFALHEARRLSGAGIPTVLVSGNHDTPRMRETGHIFRIFEGLPHVRPVYGGRLERLEVGGVTVHAVPQAVTQEAFQQELGLAQPAGRGPHVLAVHGTVLGVDGLFSSEFNEYQIRLPDLKPEFDYVALGHFHNQRRVAPNAYYAGSPESFSFNEAGQEKAFLSVDVGPGSLRVEPRPTGARPMVDLGSIDSDGKDAASVRLAAEDAVDAAPQGAVARVTLERIDRTVARTVDWEAVHARRRDLVHLEFRRRLRDDAHALDGALELHPLAQEFDGFLRRYPLPDADRDAVRESALRMLAHRGASRAA